jgi:N-acetylneuraminic acid mutarotase
MKKTFIIFVFLFITSFSWAQYVSTQLAKLPQPLSNNAVTGFYDGVNKYVYSFGGIDSTKTHGGIHNHCYKFDVTQNSWTSLPDLPQSQTRIASGASTINNTIFIIGGYHVFANGNEQSSSLVHRFDVLADTFLTNGSPLPKATDDHVQAVYKDSLIFVITGWSQNTNIPDVQIYHPVLDTWLIGTSVPNNHDYKSFGASGTIIGDTIYYFGGARYGGNFPIQSQLRKGFINPQNVTDITWDIDTIHPDLSGYRMAASAFQNSIRWAGGSNATYNYNGIGYAGAIPVEPNHRILTFHPLTNSWDTVFLPNINMDFRGVASFGCQMFLVGGMERNQKVSAQTLMINCSPNSINEQHKENENILLFPNPISNQFMISGIEGIFDITIFDINGKLVIKKNTPSERYVSVENLNPGIYFILINSNENIIRKKIIIK